MSKFEKMHKTILPISWMIQNHCLLLHIEIDTDIFLVGWCHRFDDIRFQKNRMFQFPWHKYNVPVTSATSIFECLSQNVSGSGPVPIYPCIVWKILQPATCIRSMKEFRLLSRIHLCWEKPAMLWGCQMLFQDSSKELLHFQCHSFFLHTGTHNTFVF